MNYITTYLALMALLKECEHIARDIMRRREPCRAQWDEWLGAEVCHEGYIV